jgi:hypothetical protein
VAGALLGEARGTQHRLRHQLCGDIARQADLHAGVWTRLRGAVSLAAALSLPDDLHARDLVLALTFDVILFTLLVPSVRRDPATGRLVGTKRRYTYRFGSKDGKFPWYGTRPWDGYPPEVAKYFDNGPRAQTPPSPLRCPGHRRPG